MQKSTARKFHEGPSLKYEKRLACVQAKAFATYKPATGPSGRSAKACARTARSADPSMSPRNDKGLMRRRVLAWHNLDDDLMPAYRRSLPGPEVHERDARIAGRKRFNGPP